MILRWLVYILTIFIIMWAAWSDAHETEDFKHGGTGVCYGWIITENDVRICFTNKEHTKCKLLIFAHGMFHVSKEFICDDTEKTDNQTEYEGGGR